MEQRNLLIVIKFSRASRLWNRLIARYQSGDVSWNFVQLLKISTSKKFIWVVNHSSGSGTHEFPQNVFIWKILIPIFVATNQSYPAHFLNLGNLNGISSFLA